jgi:hypothetical protein
MTFKVIRKSAGKHVQAEPSDTEFEQAGSPWESARVRLASLPGGGINIAHEALDRHVSAGHRVDAGNRAQDSGSFRRILIRGNFLLDPRFDLCDLAVQQCPEIAIHVREHVGRAEFLMRPDLHQKALSRLDELPDLGRQVSETEQFFVRKASSSIRSKGHEARDQFGVDPGRLGARAPAGGEGLDLGGR